MDCGNVTVIYIQMMILFTLWVLTIIRIGFLLMLQGNNKVCVESYYYIVIFWWILTLNCIVSRSTGNKTYEPTTWQIIFEHKNDIIRGNYTLQLALASAADANLQVHHFLYFFWQKDKITI